MPLATSIVKQATKTPDSDLAEPPTESESDLSPPLEAGALASALAQRARAHWKASPADGKRVSG